MNCLLLINLLVVLGVKSAEGKAAMQSSETDFVKLIPDQCWYLTPEGNRTERISFIIKEGYHIQTNQPLDDNLIATELKVLSLDGFWFGESVFPDAVPFHLKNDPNAMLVFYGNMVVQIPVSINNNVVTGNYKVKGTLKYQACDSVKCYYPRELNFEIPVVAR